jgi:HEAT repeat protein
MNELENYVADRLRDLIADLKSGDDDLAWDAAADLVPMGPAAEPAVPALIDVLRDRRHTQFSFYAKGMAADALGAIGPAAVATIPALMECTQADPELPEEGRWLRLRSASAIFRISGDPQLARQVAGDLMDDAEWWVREHAANLLENIRASN